MKIDLARDSYTKETVFVLELRELHQTPTSNYVINAKTDRENGKSNSLSYS